MSEDIAIKVDGVGKTFRLPHEKNNSIKGAVVGFYKRKRTYEKQQVLKGVSFEINKGEFFGIVGRNGSGKSTLLKLIAGIYSPSEGSIQVNGRLTPFIELGVGFNPELTGAENVYLNGALLGFNRKEMAAKYDDIVAFAELEKFMDQKLKNYSSGMQVRLAFSIAIRAKSDILLLDEVLAVGDAAFQQKCFNYFATLKEERKTVIFISHDMDSVLRYCTQAALIHDSKLIDIGKPKDIAELYLEKSAFENLSVKPKSSQSLVESITLLGANEVNRGNKASVILKTSVICKKPQNVILAVTILKNGQYIGGINTKNVLDVTLSQRPESYRLEIDTVGIAKGKYRLGYSVYSIEQDVYIEERIDGPNIEIIDEKQPDNTDGAVHLSGVWKEYRP